VDRVVHVAWYAEPGKYLESPRNTACFEGTMALARGAVAAGVRRFVGVGTCFEYDVAAGELSVDSPLRPWTAYGVAKVAAYEGLSRLFAAHGVSLAWCRLFYLYGEGENENRLAPYLHRRLAAGQPAELTTGEQIRDYLDVAEAGRRIAAVAMSDLTGPINVCSGVPTTVRQFAESIADQYGRRDLLHFGVRPDNPNDPAKVVGITHATGP
jgi:dTDP-6-deoxy-L-talose 4-dehydrogenase (NAD+)